MEYHPEIIHGVLMSSYVGAGDNFDPDKCGLPDLLLGLWGITRLLLFFATLWLSTDRA